MKMTPILSIFWFAVIAMAVFAPGSLAASDCKSNVKALVEGNTAFALDLYSQLKIKRGNLFLSPLSISKALAMTYAGARGQTQKEMAEVLHFDLQQEPLHKAFSQLQAQLNASQKKGQFQLSIANGLWCQQGYRFLNEFLKLIRKYYSARLHEVDFAQATEIARKTINLWVEKQTQEKIKVLFKPGVLSPATTLVLSNAIYFKGNWASQFNKKWTRPAIFFITPAQTATVDMMHQTSQFKMKMFDTFKALELPYMGNDLSMVVLLPKGTDGLTKLERSLKADNVRRWINQLSKSRASKVEVALPKFKITSEFRLKEQLKAMGMPSAFTNADFSGMTGSRELFISALAHKAFVKVNEEGTEAAAATGVAMDSIDLFRADHPFLVIIRDNHSGSILFIGRVVDPSLS